MLLYDLLQWLMVIINLMHNVICFISDFSPQAGDTPLRHATRGGHSEAIKLLLDHGANIATVNKVHP